MDDEYIENGENDDRSNPEEYFTDHKICFKSVGFRYKEVLVRLPSTYSVSCRIGLFIFPYIVMVIIIKTNIIIINGIIT